MKQTSKAKIRKPYQALAVIAGSFGCIVALAALSNVIFGSRDTKAVLFLAISLIVPIEFLCIGIRGKGVAFGPKGRWATAAICMMPLAVNLGAQFPEKWYIPLLGLAVIILAYGVTLRQEIMNKETTEQENDTASPQI